MEFEVGFTNSVRYKCLEDLQRRAVDLYLSYCGMEDVECGHHFGPHVRTEYVIHLVTKGKGTFRCEDSHYEMRENMAFLIYPGMDTEYEADLECPWSYAWVGFNGGKAHTCVTNAGFMPEKPVIPIRNMDVLLSCIQHMLEAHQLTYANDLKRSSELMRFFSTLLEDYSEENPSPGRSGYDYPCAVYVEQAIDYMQKNYDQKIKVNDLADYIGINRSYLTNSFRKIMNMSPQKFLITLRLDKAISLLRETALPIHTISAQVGYDDPLAFSKMFKQNYGISPTSFREAPEKLIKYENKNEYMRSLSI